MGCHVFLAGALDRRNLHCGEKRSLLQLLGQGGKVVARGVVAEVGQDIEDPVMLHAEFSSG
jgi:hypothetical protein